MENTMESIKVFWVAVKELKLRYSIWENPVNDYISPVWWLNLSSFTATQSWDFVAPGLQYSIAYNFNPESYIDFLLLFCCAALYSKPASR